VPHSLRVNAWSLLSFCVDDMDEGEVPRVLHGAVIGDGHADGEDKGSAEDAEDAEDRRDHRNDGEGYEDDAVDRARSTGKGRSNAVRRREVAFA